MAQAQVTTRRRRQVLGWSSLIASALLLASLLNAGVTNGTGQVVQAAPTRVLPSPSTAALADGDEVRAPLLANAPEANCEMSVRQPLYAGLNNWVTEMRWSCEVSSP